MLGITLDFSRAINSEWEITHRGLQFVIEIERLIASTCLALIPRAMRIVLKLSPGFREEGKAGFMRRPGKLRITCITSPNVHPTSR